MYTNETLKYIDICSISSCAVDRTVKYLHKPNKAVQRFTILPFKFKGSSKPKVYLHCTVLVCHAGSNTSKCTKGCEPRTTKKRSLSDKQSSVHRVTLGPIVFARQITGTMHVIYFMDDILHYLLLICLLCVHFKV